jgi:hypothetical protein
MTGLILDGRGRCLRSTIGHAIHFDAGQKKATAAHDFYGLR